MKKLHYKGTKLVMVLTPLPAGILKENKRFWIKTKLDLMHNARVRDSSVALFS
jgi:hypothetical protein